MKEKEERYFQLYGLLPRTIEIPQPKGKFKNLFEDMRQMNEKNNDITITLSRKELPTLLYMLGVMYGFSNDEQIDSIIDKIRQVALKELE